MDETILGWKDTQGNPYETWDHQTAHNRWPQVLQNEEVTMLWRTSTKRKQTRSSR